MIKEVNYTENRGKAFQQSKDPLSGKVHMVEKQEEGEG